MTTHRFSADPSRRIVQQLDRSLTRLTSDTLDPATLGRMRWFWLDSLFANISVGFFATYVPLFTLAYGATNAQVGQLAAIASLLAMVALFPGGPHDPVLRRAQAGGVALCPAAWRAFTLLALACLPWFAPDPAHAILAIIILNGIISFANSFTGPAWTSLIVDIVPAHMPRHLLAHRGQAINLVTLSVVPFAGWLIKAGNGVTGQPFAGYQLVFVFAFVAAARWLRCVTVASMSRPRLRRRSTRRRCWSARVLRRSRLFLLGFVAATLIWNFGFQISLPFFNIYLAGPLGTSAARSAC